MLNYNLALLILILNFSSFNPFYNGLSTAVSKLNPKSSGYVTNTVFVI